MSTSYPISLDSYSTKNNGDVIQPADIDNPQDAIVALETKLGVDSSAVTSTIDYKLKSTSSIDPGHKHTPSVSLATTGTPNSTSVLYGDNVWRTLYQEFGGTGADGALSIGSGTTTIDVGAASIFIKNYTSIAITGTGKLAFTNPHANGTIIILKSQGAVTLTSSTVPMIDASSMGGNNSVQGQSNFGFASNFGLSGALSSGSPGVAGGTAAILRANLVKCILLACGAGGGSGGATSGGTTSSGGGGGGASISSAGVTGTGGGTGSGSSNTNNNFGTGGRGGGALYIECGGSYNCTGTLSVAGSVGNSGSVGGGGGGGGGGGCIVARYNALTADSGTYTVSGGAGGSGGANTGGSGGPGGVGGAGYSNIGINDFA